MLLKSYIHWFFKYFFLWVKLYFSDINECLFTSECLEMYGNECINTEGSYYCNCIGDGFKPTYGQTACITDDQMIQNTSESEVVEISEADKCKEELSNCHMFADCFTTNESNVCACKFGFIGDGINCEGWFDSYHELDFL